MYKMRSVGRDVCLQGPQVRLCFTSPACSPGPRHYGYKSVGWIKTVIFKPLRTLNYNYHFSLAGAHCSMPCTLAQPSRFRFKRNSEDIALIAFNCHNSRREIITLPSCYWVANDKIWKYQWRRFILSSLWSFAIQSGIGVQSTPPLIRWKEW